MKCLQKVEDSPVQVPEARLCGLDLETELLVQKEKDVPRPAGCPALAFCPVSHAHPPDRSCPWVVEAGFSWGTGRRCFMPVVQPPVTEDGATEQPSALLLSRRRSDHFLGHKCPLRKPCGY